MKKHIVIIIITGLMVIMGLTVYAVSEYTSPMQEMQVKAITPEIVIETDEAGRLPANESEVTEQEVNGEYEAKKIESENEKIPQETYLENYQSFDSNTNQYNGIELPLDILN